MSKNTNVSGFRKINIDAFDPENYQDDEPNSQQADEGGPNESEIVSLLNKYVTGQLWRSRQETVLIKVVFLLYF